MLAQDGSAGLDRFVHVVVWRPWLEAASTERISWTGQAIGRQIGQALAQRPGLRSLHVSGTSAGGFAANECVAAYVAAAGAKRASTRLTLCDPFCARADEVQQVLARYMLELQPPASAGDKADGGSLMDQVMQERAALQGMR